MLVSFFEAGSIELCSKLHNLLQQGRPEAAKRAKAMVAKMDELGFGNCTNTRACEAVCPKNETIANIARLNREFIKAKLAD